ncbi:MULTISPECIES: type II toxin-antitoxin system RelE family toxin [Streptomyces]|uniref:type II toxin-antitoxin system RelE family toxin n=1 Tax=Streptomyces TaxID=1883 RepID=UPI00339E3448
MAQPPRRPNRGRRHRGVSAHGGDGGTPPVGQLTHGRLRVGSFRVVHTVEDGQLIVWVLAVGHRREI